MFGAVTCPICGRRYNKYISKSCPSCDGIDFGQISFLRIVSTEEMYHEEVYFEENPYMSDFLSEQFGHPIRHTTEVHEEVYDGTEYTFQISYKNGTWEERAYLDTTDICQRLLKLESEIGLTGELNKIEKGFADLGNALSNMFNPDSANNITLDTWAKYLCDTYYASKESLTEKLVEKGFTSEQVTEALEKLNVNWYTKAAERAKEYLESFNCSYASMVKMLERDEKFTHEEALYGAANCGADWREQAVHCAEKYAERVGFDYDKLVFQIEFFDYPHEDAVYAATKVLGMDRNKE